MFALLLIYSFNILNTTFFLVNCFCFCSSALCFLANSLKSISNINPSCLINLWLIKNYASSFIFIIFKAFLFPCETGFSFQYAFVKFSILHTTKIFLNLLLRGEISLEPLKKAVFFNFIMGEWKRSKSGFLAYIRRHYLTSKKNFFHNRKIQNGGNMTDPVDSFAANIFCGR